MNPSTQTTEDFPATYLAIYEVNKQVGYHWLQTFQGAIAFLETIEAKGAKPIALVVDKIVWKAPDVTDEQVQAIVNKLTVKIC